MPSKKKRFPQISQNIKDYQMASHLQVPFIDLSQLTKENADINIWNSMKKEVFEALQEYGCFEATFDGISTELLKSVTKSLEQLFDLPYETKLKNSNERVFDGYIANSKGLPLYESMAIEDATSHKKVQNFTTLMWPHGNPTFGKNIQMYSEKLSKLDEMVRRMVLESLNLEKYEEEHMDLTNHLLRIQKYRVPEENEPALGLRAHTDKNFLTILYQGEVGGFEFETKNGEWIPVKVNSPNSFVVMAGESYNAWTNGRIHASNHRVVMNGDKTRYSLALFSLPKVGKIVKTPEEMIDQEHPLLFKPFVFSEFLEFFYSMQNIGDLSVLKTYCGVDN